MNDRRLLRWQIITVVTLWVGYAGYYVCRSNLTVNKKQVTAELAEEYKSKQDPADHASEQSLEKAASRHGNESLGLIFSAGVFFYAIGKFLNGVMGDFLGGRVMFLLGMIGSVICTIFFGALVGFVTWVVIWSINRFVQSMGWVSLVKLSSRWFPRHRHGMVLGVLSTSYLFGDSLARVILGLLLDWQLGWRQVFFCSAAVLAVIAVVSYFLLKSSPSDIGEEEPEVNPGNVYGQRGEAVRPDGLFDLLRPFLSSSSFWLVCMMNFGLTMIRETFNNWNTTYLQDVVKLSEADAGYASALFPFVGGLAALWAGRSTDKTGKRSGVIIFYLTLLIIATLLMAGSVSFASNYSQTTQLVITLTLMSVTAFALIGPYSLLSGVCALDLGGKKGSATAAGVIDSAGYFGGALAGWGVIWIKEEHGWSAAFVCLGVVALLSLSVAGVYWWLHERTPNSPLKKSQS